MRSTISQADGEGRDGEPDQVQKVSAHQQQSSEIQNHGCDWLNRLICTLESSKIHLDMVNISLAFCAKW